VLPAHPNNLLHHPSTNKTLIEDRCQVWGCLKFGLVFRITHHNPLTNTTPKCPLHESLPEHETGDTIGPAGKLSFRQAFRSPWLRLGCKPRSAGDRLLRDIIWTSNLINGYTIIESGLSDPAECHFTQRGTNLKRLLFCLPLLSNRSAARREGCAASGGRAKRSFWGQTSPRVLAVYVQS
jgi:hypothetical protein